MSLEEVIEAAVERAVRKAFTEERKPAAVAEDDLLSVASAARLAEVSTATVRRWISSGTLRRYGTGRVVRVRRADLLALAPDDASSEDAATVSRLLGRK